MDMDAGSNKGSRADESVSSLGTDDHAAAPEPMSASPPPATATARPYYECVFCKRGFTTAQALGGHMNIHRRDRAAKPGPGAAAPPRDASTTTVSRSVECYSQYRHLAAATSGAAGSSSSFAMYHGSTGAGEEAAAVGGPRELSLFDAATDHGLHLGVGRRGGGGESRTPEGSEQQVAGELPERELDLELRLGRHTKH
uniref:C2H2-type domain-containing protein n=1 Tax=Oryza meridionalis TaxID=40149 RepID=A0A0E0DBF1_9ORYZ